MMGIEFSPSIPRIAAPSASIYALVVKLIAPDILDSLDILDIFDVLDVLDVFWSVLLRVFIS